MQLVNGNKLNAMNMATSNVKKTTPSIEYYTTVNQIHWSQWVCPADGFVMVNIGLLTNRSPWYYYINDDTLDLPVGKIAGTIADGTSRIMCFPVIKGHTYKVNTQYNVDGASLQFYYYKFT